MKTDNMISPLQMTVLLVVYMTGSTILFVPSTLLAQSGNAFWLAMLVSGVFGCLPLGCMLYLHRRFPGETLIEGGIRTIGYPVTVLLMVPYIVFMVLLQAYIYFSIGAFFTTTMMRDTPVFIFNGLIAMISALTVRAGALVMARMFVLLSFLLIGVIILVLVFNMENYHLDYLLPVLPMGIKPVFHSAYLTSGFIYGDFLVFAFVFAYLRPKEGKTATKPIFLGYLINWLLISCVSLCILMALGPLTNEYQYPLFILSRLISIQEIFERLESIIGMSMMAGSYMKATITLFALNTALTRLLKQKDDGQFVYPLALLGMILSLTVVRNEADFGNVLLTWPMLTFTVSLTLYVFTLIAHFRKRETKN
ncbi:GerAB/ArcD/ProY family transporter [Cohnella herbarum]|uniref:Endospore germination permease n=1 Tax=Cohnella herbarum TaxID=2728023 RepID=A0A7Z2ZKG1_9BACL|nr:endospore germination permease [Cohnella herbarum]QJD82744.1 endospore germination permease [Cohnella herbarum]